MEEILTRDERVKIIRSFCAGKLAFIELPSDVKQLMIDYGYITREGNFTEMGNIYKNAVIINQDMNQKHHI